MKNSKTLRITIDIILIILGIIFLVFGIKDAIEMVESTKIEDSVLFKKDYTNVSENNVYKYLNLKETNKLLEEYTGVLLISNPNDSWTQVLVEPLNDIAIKNGISIYYLENKNLDTESKFYKNILLKLNVEKLSNPTLTFVEEGKINKILLKYDIYDKEYNGAPIEYWTEELKQKLSEELTNEINSLK